MNPGQRLGAYEILGELAQGSKSTVYRAYQGSLDRFVAVKALQKAAGDPASLERFRQQARSVARLRHPNIIPVYDFGEQDDVVYIVMELVEGTSLRDILGEPLVAERALAVVTQVASALDAAHANGVVHGDVKPSNILLSTDGRAMLGDFVNPLVPTEPDAPVQDGGGSTPAYATPEQAAGHPANAASDIYALGVVAFHLLTGKLPFQAASPQAMLAAHLREQPLAASALNPALSSAVDEVLRRALAKDQGERYQSASGFASSLREATLAGPLNTMATRASTPAPQPALGPGRGRRWVSGSVFRVAAALGAGLLVAGGAWAALSGGFGGPPRGDAGSPAIAGPAATETEQPLAPAPSPGDEAPTAEPAAASPVPVEDHSMHMAASRDGVNFSTDQQLEGPQGFFITAFGTPGAGIRVYTTSTRGGRLRAWASSDYRRWTEQPLQNTPTTVFADLVRLPDGTFRLYYVPAAPVAQVAEMRELRSATSTDGIVFNEESGGRWTGAGLVYPSVAHLDGRWTLIFSLTDGRGGVRSGSAESRDGLSFSASPGVAVPVGATKISAYDGLLHLFVLGPTLTSWTSKDGQRWQLDPGARLRTDGSRAMLQGAIVKTDDGVYRLFYTLARPSGG